MVHSNRTVVSLLYKHFSSWFSIVCNSSAHQELYVRCYEQIQHCAICQQFVHLLQVSLLGLISVMIVLCRFFTLIALGDVNLCFSLILVTKANVVEGGTTSATWLYNQHTQSTHVTEGVTVTSLSSILQHKTSAARDHCAKLRYIENYRMNTKHGVNVQVMLRWNCSKINRTLDNTLAGICFM
jgi:hypothetical protein